MSKASQQQSTTSRDRAASTPPRPKQPGKADGNGAKPATARDVVSPAAADKAHEFGIVPAESAEDDFFARGEAAHSSLPPAAMDLVEDHDLDDLPEVRPLTPAQLERRARLRRIVGGVVGAAAVLTAVVGAKALAAVPSKVTAADASLSVPHQVVPSIALAAQQEEPAAESAKTAALDKGTAAVPGAAADPAPVAENAAQPPQEPATEPAAAAKGPETAAKEMAAPAATTRRLPVLDIEIPASTDPAVDQQWESAAKNLSSQDFKGADNAFAELGKKSDPATRETARLARAAWWTANGRQSEVKPVISDLAANATTPSVRQRARDLLRAN